MNAGASVFVPGRGMVHESVLAAEKVASETPAKNESKPEVKVETKEVETNIEKRSKSEEKPSSSAVSPASTPKQAPTTESKETSNTTDEKAEDDGELFGDAGKSTISGQVLLLTGRVDKRTIEKYEREAKDKGRESWWLAFIMDTNEEERAKGKTVEVGRAHFETAQKRYTVLDAPGHKNYVPNMIAGAAQADVAVLVISARKGEFETGFERGGQTREHARLVRTAGVRYLVVAINKMDEPTVKYSQARFQEIVDKLSPYLRQTGFNLKTDVMFVPISGYTGGNIQEPFQVPEMSWYKGATLLSTLDSIQLGDRNPNGPVRVPILDKYRDGGRLFVMGKVESGTLRVGQKLQLAPSVDNCEVHAIGADNRAMTRAAPGENVRIVLKGIEEETVHSGFVLCSAPMVPCVTQFEVQVVILELLESCPIFTAGYECVIHIHSAVEEVRVKVLIAKIDKKTQEITERRPKFVKAGEIVRCMLVANRSIALESFKDNPQLGRFTLRDSGKTIAIGKVLATAPKGEKPAK